MPSMINLQKRLNRQILYKLFENISVKLNIFLITCCCIPISRDSTTQSVIEKKTLMYVMFPCFRNKNIMLYDFLFFEV